MGIFGLELRLREKTTRTWNNQWCSNEQDMPFWIYTWKNWLSAVRILNIKKKNCSIIYDCKRWHAEWTFHSPHRWGHQDVVRPLSQYVLLASLDSSLCALWLLSPSPPVPVSPPSPDLADHRQSFGAEAGQTHVNILHCSQQFLRLNKLPWMLRPDTTVYITWKLKWYRS